MIRKYLSLLFLGLIWACSTPPEKSPCSSTNPVFNDHAYDSEIYIEELAQELFARDEYELEYFFEEYIIKNNAQYIKILGKENGICIHVLLRVYDWTGIEELKKDEGKAYIGARLEGLEFATLRKGESLEFMYQGISAILR